MPAGSGSVSNRWMFLNVEPVSGSASTGGNTPRGLVVVVAVVALVAIAAVSRLLVRRRHSARLEVD